RALAWVDIGWIGGKVLEFAKDNEKTAEDLDKFEEETGFDPELIVTKGDNRITAAFAVAVDTSADKWDITLQTLNGETLLMGSSIFFLARSFATRVEEVAPAEPSRALPAFPTAAPTPPGADSTGVQACDDYFETVENCN